MAPFVAPADTSSISINVGGSLVVRHCLSALPEETKWMGCGQSCCFFVSCVGPDKAAYEKVAIHLHPTGMCFGYFRPQFASRSPPGCVGACVCARLANMASRLMKCIHLHAHPSPFQTKETSLSGGCLCIAAIRACTHTYIHTQSKRKQTPDGGIPRTMAETPIPVETSLLVGSKCRSAVSTKVHLAIETHSQLSGRWL